MTENTRNEGNAAFLTDEALGAVAGGALSSDETVCTYASSIRTQINSISNFLPEKTARELGEYAESIQRTVISDPNAAKATLHSLTNALSQIIYMYSTHSTLVNTANCIIQMAHIMIFLLSQN